VDTVPDSVCAECGRSRRLLLERAAEAVCVDCFDRLEPAPRPPAVDLQREYVWGGRRPWAELQEPVPTPPPPPPETSPPDARRFFIRYQDGRGEYVRGETTKPGAFTTARAREFQRLGWIVPVWERPDSTPPAEAAPGTRALPAAQAARAHGPEAAFQSAEELVPALDAAVRAVLDAKRRPTQTNIAEALQSPRVPNDSGGFSSSSLRRWLKELPDVDLTVIIARALAERHESA
jgi:hypothetical protein